MTKRTDGWNDAYKLIFISFAVIFLTRPLMNNIYNSILHAKKREKNSANVNIHRKSTPTNLETPSDKILYAGKVSISNANYR